MALATISYKSNEPERVDHFLSHKYSYLSRSRIEKLIQSGQVLINSTPAKPSTRLKKGDKLRFPRALFELKQPPKTVLPIIYQDDFCIVLDKPSGVITHTKGTYSNEASVASFIADKIDPALSGNRAGIVHRLDRGTSGVIIAAKSEAAQKYLQRQFAKRQTAKTYLAVVSGKLEREQAEVDMPIERNPKKPATFRVSANGKPAQTTYRVIKTNGRYSLLELTPTTGRTHQLRVHLAAIGHPIVGDDLYLGEPAKRLMLHAAKLSVILPDKGRTTFESKAPKEFATLLKG